ncbi:hypothetical protein acsn021_26250 [Anaerocolumna cellulosilytica]|uniref:Uncharacterized protein n=1 Tax=Anaerocolumna cellulosilytica TaxID=433286 RepID=A0A6S6QZ61_9FIRM|nr:hypothetical protein [Anaerocolumna cellulosilytica]MBB5193727.1 archaellum component FlaC [Anaerocolumna cellulosilytica]BCJ95056.1 hypothetical protein acsn021_26250 [Anaerocolumna cellulosilytica]
MKFKIFSLSEKLYRMVTALVTIGVTIGCFVYYNKLDDKGDTFVIATVYAAFLFIVGLYLSYMSNSISNKLYERKNEYIMLRRLNEIFSTSCMTSLDSYRDICFAVISFQAFSGRTKGYISKDEKKKAIKHTVPLEFMMEPQTQIDNNNSAKEKHYIKEIGFKFEPKLQKVEDSYNLEYSKLKASIQETINAYITKNKIELNIRGGFFELDLLETNYDDWCNEYVSEKSSEKKEALIQYLYKIIDVKQTDFSNLDIKKKQIVKYYRKCNKRIQSNLKRMNHTYGNRLEFIIKIKEDILEELESLSDRIERIECIIESKASDSINTINECNRNISGIYSELQELQENIVTEIQVDIEMLEEDLGIEFNSKEKFKELMRRRKEK